jgi:hypothetical protein
MKKFQPCPVRYNNLGPILGMGGLSEMDITIEEAIFKLMLIPLLPASSRREKNTGQSRKSRTYLNF